MREDEAKGVVVEVESRESDEGAYGSGDFSGEAVERKIESPEGDEVAYVAGERMGDEVGGEVEMLERVEAPQV